MVQSKTVRSKPFVLCNILMVCILLSVQEDTAAPVIGPLSIDEESGLETYPDSSKVDGVWKDPDTCKITGAAIYDIYEPGVAQSCVKN